MTIREKWLYIIYGWLESELIQVDEITYFQMLHNCKGLVLLDKGYDASVASESPINHGLADGWGNTARGMWNGRTF